MYLIIQMKNNLIISSLAKKFCPIIMYNLLKVIMHNYHAILLYIAIENYRYIIVNVIYNIIIKLLIKYKLSIFTVYLYLFICSNNVHVYVKKNI